MGRCCRADEVYSVGHCCQTGQMWDSVTRRCVGSDEQCADNDDCLANEFCDYVNVTSCTERPTKGVCKLIAVSHTKKIEAVTYKRSRDYISWWSAENFCARIGGEMVGMADFSCNYDFVANKKLGYCNVTDPEVDVQDISKTGKRSPTIAVMRSGLSSPYVWTRDDLSACSSFYVGLSDGSVHSIYRYHDNNVALCRLMK